MSLIRLNKQTEPVNNPPTNKVFLGVNTTGPYMKDEAGNITYLGVQPSSQIYGSGYNVLESNTITNTTSRITKINGNTSNLPIGKYKINISYNWLYEDKDTNFISYFKFDGLNVGGSNIIHTQRPRDNGIDQVFAYSTSFFVNVTTPGIKSVLLEFEPQDVINARMWNASIEIFRVS